MLVSQAFRAPSKMGSGWSESGLAREKRRVTNSSWTLGRGHVMATTAVPAATRTLYYRMRTRAACSYQNAQPMTSIHAGSSHMAPDVSHTRDLWRWSHYPHWRNEDCRGGGIKITRRARGWVRTKSLCIWPHYAVSFLPKPLQGGQE